MTNVPAFEDLLQEIASDIFNELPDNFKEIDHHFQPIVNVRDGDIFGYEALARPFNGDSILLLIQKAKQRDFLGIFDLYLRLKAIYKAYVLGIFPEKYLFLNVEPNCLVKKRPSGVTKEFLRALNLPQEKIVLEIGENSLPEDYQKFYDTLNYFRRQGFNIAVDDFGVGCISYRVLYEFPPDYIKIDRFFVQQIPNPFFKKTIYHFIELAQDLKTEIIVEGVEKEEEFQGLSKIGIILMQGFYFGKPTPIPKRVIENYKKYVYEYYVYSLWVY